MSTVVCVCGCPQGRHLLARRDCKTCPECAQFRPVAAAPVALDVTVLLGEVQAEAGQEAELAAQLAEARQEAKRYRDMAESVRAVNDVLRSQLDQVAVSGPGRLYDSHVRHLCTVCGGRYRELHNHPCGPLVPVRVRITFIEE